MNPQAYPDLSSANSSTDNLSNQSRMSLAYMNRVLDIISDHKDVKATATGVLKQTGITAAGCAAGGLLMGPAGALIGGVLGAIAAYSNADDYDCLITAINKMSDNDKERLGAKVQQLVGAVSIEEFVRWIATEGHRQILLGVLSDFANKASSSK